MKLGIARYIIVLVIAIAAVFQQSPHLVFKVPMVGWALGLLAGYGIPPFFNKAVFSKCYDEANCPWLNSGDVVIASCPKCGTNWMMTAVHELRTWDQPELRDFRDILDVVPWPVLVPHPAADRDHPEKEWGNDWNNSNLKFHIFKATSPPVKTENNKMRSIILPVRERRDVRFLVMVRNPVDMFHSAATFFSTSNTPHWNALWGDLPRLTSTPMELFERSLSDWYFSPFHFFKEWMEFAENENVLILHYSNVLNDTKSNLKIIAEFIGLKDIPEEAFEEINERVSFEYMKKRGDKYTYLAGVNKSLPMTYSSSLIKTGGSYVGSSKDKLTPEEKEKINEFGKQLLGNKMNRMFAEGFEAIQSKKV